MIDLTQTDHIKTFGNSMYPLLHNGDILYYKKVIFQEIDVDDIIIFYKNETYITHRVIYKKDDYVITKGDNVLGSDGKVFSQSIIGKVFRIKRENSVIDLTNLYLIQSAVYLRELSTIFTTFTRKKIPFIVLKGLPLTQFYLNSIPKRIYADCDILTEKTKEKVLKGVFSNHLYKENEYLLMRENDTEGRHLYEQNYFKFVQGIPVSVDVHFEAVFNFTRIDISWYIYPSTLLDALTHYFLHAKRKIVWNGISISILTPPALIVYLCLHFFHHNYKGTYRLEFLYQIVTHEMKEDRNMLRKVSAIADEYKLHGFVDPVFEMLNIHYDMGLPLQRVCSPSLSLWLKRKLVTTFFSNSWDDEGKLRSGVTKYFLLFLLSPVPFYKRIWIFFDPRVIRHTIAVIMRYIRLSILTKKN